MPRRELRAIVVFAFLSCWTAQNFLLTATVRGDEAGSEWETKWKNGFQFNSPDGAFKLKLGGRIQVDFSFADPDGVVESVLGPIEDGSEFRRSRLFVSGTIYGNVEFKAQYDFAGGDADFNDVYIGLRETPLGNIRIGHFFEPFSLEQHTSSKYITFLERGLPNVLVPARNVGIMFHDTVGDRLLWAAGLFREADSFGLSSGDGQLNVTGRLVGLPIRSDGDRKLLHLGLSLSRKDLGDASFRFRQRPEAHLSPRFVDTGSFDAESVDLLALEAAVNSGSFHAQGEFITAQADAADLGDPTFDGFYLQAGYFFTGEHRPYTLKQGGFGRIKPNRIFAKDGGPGAWELALRYSTLDLSDEAIAGGELDSFTLAVNWYLNPVTRMQINYVTADLQDVGDSDFMLLRLQIDF